MNAAQNKQPDWLKIVYKKDTFYKVSGKARKGFITTQSAKINQQHLIFR